MTGEDTISVERRLEHFKRAQRHARIGSFEHDLRTGETFLSDEHYRLLGYAPGEIAPSLDIFLNQLSPATLARFMRRLRVSISTGRDFRMDVPFTPKNGYPRVAHIRAEFEQDETGRVSIVSGTFQDVTGRRKTEKALRRSEARYRSIFDNALEGIYQTTPDGRFLNANDAMAKITGYDSPSDLMTSIGDIGRDLYVNPAERALLVDLLGEYSRVMGFESRLRRKDGQEIWVCLNASLMQDTATGTPCILGTMEDISKRKQFELALIESGKRFRNLLEQINFIAVSMDREGAITFSNPFLHQLTGWNERDLAGRNWFDTLVPADIREGMRTALTHTAAPGDVRGLESEILTRAGERRLIRWNTVTDLDTHGKISGITCLGVDMTEVRRARDTLAASERLHAMRLRIANAMHEAVDFRDLMRTVHEVLAEAVEARNLIIAVLNPDTKSLEFPYWVDELTDISEAAPSIDDIDDPENRRLTLELLRGNIPNIMCGEAMRSLARSGRIKVVGEIPRSWMGAVLKIRGKGIGTVVVQNYSSPAHYSPEDLEVLLSISDQIAMAIEHQRHDDIARTAEQIMQDIPSGLFIYKYHDPDNLVLENANPTALRLIGRELDEARGMLFTDIWPGGTMLGPYLHCLRTRERLDKDAHYYEDDSIRGYFRLHAFALPGEKLAVAFEDVTERELARQALVRAKDIAESANRTKSEFLANISHEVRTPLNGIMGMVQLCLQSRVPPEIEGYLRTALGSSRNLLRVLNDVLDFTKVDAGKMELLEKEFDLDGLLEQAMDFFRAQAMDKRIRLTLSKPSRLGCFIGDEGRLRQVLFNLMGNALKFTEDGEVCLEAWPVGDEGEKARILFEVRDNGIGIPPDKLGYIFESFTQVDGSYSRQYQGTGLGLPIVRRLVKLMGGNVFVESEENEGTSILFVLRLQRGRAGALPAVRTPEFIPGEIRPLRVLLVEDDVVNMTMARRMLEKMGHSVICAHTGVEALERLQAPGVDVILMDIQMPQMDGMEATRILRTDPRYASSARIPVIALTAHAMSGDMERFLARGMDAYLSKPFDHARLQELLHRFFA